MSNVGKPPVGGNGWVPTRERPDPTPRLDNGLPRALYQQPEKASPAAEEPAGTAGGGWLTGHE